MPTYWITETLAQSISFYCHARFTQTSWSIVTNPRIDPLSALVIYDASFMKILARIKLAVTYFQQYGSINSLSSYTTIRNDNNRWYQDQRRSRARL